MQSWCNSSHATGICRSGTRGATATCATAPGTMLGLQHMGYVAENRVIQAALAHRLKQAGEPHRLPLAGAALFKPSLGFVCMHAVPLLHLFSLPSALHQGISPETPSACRATRAGVSGGVLQLA